jgi:sporulation protein YunB
MSGRKKLVLIALIVSLLVMLQTFFYVDRSLKPPLFNLAKVRLKQVASQAINTAISNRIAQGTSFDQLMLWKTDTNGKVTGIMFNSTEQMRITADTVSTVSGLLNNLKTIPEHIPLGQAFHSPIIASFGPKIPVRLIPAGIVRVDLRTRSQNAGINMLLVEVYMHISAEVTIIIPFDSEPEIVETDLPISYALVVGDTPVTYFDNKGNPVNGSSPIPPGTVLPGTTSNNKGTTQSGVKK